MPKTDLNQMLKLFKISLQAEETPILSIPMTDMVQASHMTRFVEIYAPMIQALEPGAAATSFGGWFGFLTAGLHYFLSVRNTTIDLSLRNLTVQLYPVGPHHRFAFHLDDFHEMAGPVDGAQRQAWRKQVLETFYAATVRPLFTALSKAANISIGQLWGQLPIKVAMGMERFSVGADARTSQTLADDYQCLRTELDASVFGLKRNPFAVQMRKIESEASPHQLVYMKTACCLDHCRVGGAYCFTCPRISESTREVRREAFRAAQAQ
ncbi:hypothetical protein [Alicyclobacillus fodiniaquatilis]|uniref:Ferric iron reductase protein FhuF n=1 Tax=Alicyclobacillus fodiniaquatilis TaxID=1661150 RepID=A0ABW4JNR2_9BACL